MIQNQRRLMHDLHCKRQMRCTVRFLQNECMNLKETQKGVELICHEMRKSIVKEWKAERKWRAKGKKETALSMAEEGMNIQKDRTSG